MHGALALRNGVLYVGRHEQTAHLRPYDLDGRALGLGFSFRGPGGAACLLGGIDVDEDHHVWVADRASSRVRAFSLFGREVAGFQGQGDGSRDARGVLRPAVDVAVVPNDDQDADDSPSLIVASGGRRRHAVQRFRADGTWQDSLRPLGEPRGEFFDVRRIVVHGSKVFVCEGRAGRVQVFRGGEFHFAFRPPDPRPPSARRGDGIVEPVSLAVLDDGRMVLATGGAWAGLMLLDASGRLLELLAEPGLAEGRLSEPGDLVVEEAGGDPRARIAVIDRDAERVQVFTLEGRCFGALESLPGRAL
jgi:hypothetical protein